MLYPVPGDGPARVCCHYCGERLTATGLAHEEWLELLLRARGAAYGPRRREVAVGFVALGMGIVAMRRRARA